VASHGPGAGGAGLYEVLGLNAGASEEAIRSAVTEQRRVWRRRTTSPELEIRHEAERRMHLLDQAERTLLDPARRRSYDAQFAAPAQARAQEKNWLVRAVQQMEDGQHEVAVFSARHAVEADPENPYAWSVLASASAGAGDAHNAVNAIERAISLEPENASLHVKRGDIFTKAGQHDRALHAYRAAAGLEPRNVQYRGAVVHSLTKQGRLDAAIAEAELIYQANPDDGEARNILAQALADRATAAQHELPNGQLIIASLSQASHVDSLSNRGLSVQAPNPMVNDELRRHKKRSRDVRQRRLSAPALRKNYRFPLGTGLIATALLCCAPGMLGDGASNQVSTALVALTILAVVAFGVVLVATCFEPVYRRNAQVIENIVPRRRGRGPGEPDPR
jgi:Tfp pilus assembly protein PilF